MWFILIDESGNIYWQKNLNMELKDKCYIINIYIITYTVHMCIDRLVKNFLVIAVIFRNNILPH